MEEEEEEVEELYVEGLASHDGPESCAGVREGAGEALTGVRAGGAIEPRNQGFGVPTLFRQAEGDIGGGVIRESSRNPARSENLCMRGTSRRENREVPWPPVRVIAGRAAQGRLRPQA